MKSLARLIGAAGLAAVAAVSPIRANSEDFSYMLENGVEREIVYGVDDFPIYNQDGGLGRQEVLADSDKGATLTQMLETAPVDFKKVSDEVVVLVEPDERDYECMFTYYNRSGKKEKAGGTHFYVFYPKGAEVYIKNQDLLDKDGKIIKSLIPGVDTDGYRAAQKINDYFGGNNPLFINSDKETEGVTDGFNFYNEYTDLSNRLPGKAGAVAFGLTAATKFIMSEGEKQRQEGFQGIFDSEYSLGKIELYTSDIFEKHVPLAGRRVHLGFRGAEGEDCFLVVPSLQSSDRNPNGERMATVRDLIFGFKMGYPGGSHLGEDYALFSGTSWKAREKDSRGNAADTFLEFNKDGNINLKTVAIGVDSWQRQNGHRSGETTEYILKTGRINKNEDRYKFIFSKETGPDREGGVTSGVTGYFNFETRFTNREKLGLRMLGHKDPDKFTEFERVWKKGERLRRINSKEVEDRFSEDSLLNRLRGTYWISDDPYGENIPSIYSFQKNQIIFEDIKYGGWGSFNLSPSDLPVDRGVLFKLNSIQKNGPLDRITDTPDEYLNIDLLSPKKIEIKAAVRKDGAIVFRGDSEYISLVPEFKNRQSSLGNVGTEFEEEIKSILDTQVLDRRNTILEVNDPRGRSNCIKKLKQIDLGKYQLQITKGLLDGDVNYDKSDIDSSIQYGAPKCLSGGEYNYGPIGEDPTCSVHVDVKL
jgi:hypothetical protein